MDVIQKINEINENKSQYIVYQQNKKPIKLNDIKDKDFLKKNIHKIVIFNNNTGNNMLIDKLTNIYVNRFSNSIILWNGNSYNSTNLLSNIDLGKQFL